jgi:predicted O-methyltransferase YrrM
VLTLDGAPARSSRGEAQRKAGFIVPYLFAAVSAVYLFALGWIRPRHRAVIVGLADHFGYHHNAREAPALPTITPSGIAPQQTLVDLHEPAARDGNVSELELILLSRITRESEAGAIFEIGTFDGRTTLNLAANSPADTRIYTLDLPREQLDRTAAPTERYEAQFVDKTVSGSRYRGTGFESKITQLYGDSGTFDFEAWYDSIDLVFVDASHAYEYVINDSLQALRLLKNQRGTIVWHDYGNWDGVTAALNDLRERHPSFANVAHIEGTSLALLML